MDMVEAPNGEGGVQTVTFCPRHAKPNPVRAGERGWLGSRSDEGLTPPLPRACLTLEQSLLTALLPACFRLAPDPGAQPWQGWAVSRHSLTRFPPFPGVQACA
jgi:hypothetical protein